MKKIIALSLLAGLILAPGLAAETAKSIIRQVDNNRLYTTEEFKVTMTIVKGKQTLTKTFFGYGMKAGNKASMAFTNAEDQGVKYLKLQDELWIYFPDADDIMKISGHMLRQGMMGSDLSYEDMLENDSLEEKYSYQRLADEKIRERDCYVVELNAQKPDVVYEKQKLFIDKERFVALELELYARGGRLLKKMSQTDITQVNNRWVPMKMTIRDMRKKDSETTIKFNEIRFDTNISDKVFTKAFLKR